MSTRVRALGSAPNLRRRRPMSPSQQRKKQRDLPGGHGERHVLEHPSVPEIFCLVSFWGRLLSRSVRHVICLFDRPQLAISLVLILVQLLPQQLQTKIVMQKIDRPGFLCRVGVVSLEALGIAQENAECIRYVIESNNVVSGTTPTLKHRMGSCGVNRPAMPCRR